MGKLAFLFLRLGATSFGGPAAHIAMMEEEFVHRRKWLSREKFLDLIALTNLIPGPNSTEMAIHIGYLRAGWWGFWIAGVCFILPAFFIVTLIAHYYVTYASLPQGQHFLVGAKAAVLAIIVQAFDRFFRTCFKTTKYSNFLSSSFWTTPTNQLRVFIFIASLYLSAKGSSELLILFTAGLIALFFSARLPGRTSSELGSLFWVFFKVGSVLFGSGYVLVRFLQTELVENHQWISQAQLLDAITVGQFTPGPVFTTASFLGYLLEGFPGAVTATLGIFLPAFVFVALSIPLHAKLQSSKEIRQVLDGVVVASVALLTSTLWTFSWDLATSPGPLLLFAGSLVLLLRTRIPNVVLILVSGLLTLLF